MASRTAPLHQCSSLLLSPHWSNSLLHTSSMYTTQKPEVSPEWEDGRGYRALKGISISRLVHRTSKINGYINIQAPLAYLHTSTHTCTHCTCAYLHVLVWLYYGHKHLPRQAVSHMSMPATNVGDTSRYIAAKMEVQVCIEDGVHKAPGPYWSLQVRQI